MFAAGRMWCRLTNCGAGASGEGAREFGLDAVALDGVGGDDGDSFVFRLRGGGEEQEQAVELCIPRRAGRDVKVMQISIETAQPKLDCSVLERLQNKIIILGGVGSFYARDRDAGGGGGADTAGASLYKRAAEYWGSGLRDEVFSSLCRVRKDSGDGGGRGAGARRDHGRGLSSGLTLWQRVAVDVEHHVMTTK